MLLKRECPKCGAEWIPRVEKPLKCPRCQFALHTVQDVLDREEEKKKQVES